MAASASAGAPVDGAGSRAAVSDDGHLLTGRQRATLEQLVRAKSVECGSPLSVRLLRRLPPHQAIGELARQAFVSDGLDAPGPPRVLLAVAWHEHQAAIETGQGPAGIVPEIDARRITDRLDGALIQRGLGAALEEAVAAIAASARATAERRRPSPPEPPEAVAPPLPSSPAGPGPAGRETRPNPDHAPGVPSDTPPKPGTSREGSLMPAAYLLAAFIVLGLALRRRRRLAEDRATGPQGPARPGGKPDRDVKSVGERRMS